MKNWENVTKDELTEFVNSYPYELDTDYYMGIITWNDFRDGRVFPESMIAVVDETGDDCRIYKDYI